MGLTKLRVEVGNPARKDIFEGVEFIVDSGGIYSVVPRVFWSGLVSRSLWKGISGSHPTKACVGGLP